MPCSYFLHIPAKETHIAAVWEMAQKDFGSDLPSRESDLAAHLKNPYQLVTIVNNRGEVVPYTNIFVLYPEVFDDLIHNKIKEDMLDPGHFVPWPDAQKSEHIYCAATAVADRKHPDRPILANALQYGRLALLKHYLKDKDSIHCALIAYTRGGEKMAGQLRFEKAGDHDYGSLYQRSFTFGTIAELMTRVLMPLDPRISVVCYD